MLVNVYMVPSVAYTLSMKVTISECEGNNDEAPTPETVR